MYREDKICTVTFSNIYILYIYKVNCLTYLNIKTLTYFNRTCTYFGVQTYHRTLQAGRIKLNSTIFYGLSGQTVRSNQKIGKPFGPIRSTVRIFSLNGLDPIDRQNTHVLIIFGYHIVDQVLHSNQKNSPRLNFLFSLLNCPYFLSWEIRKSFKKSNSKIVVLLLKFQLSLVDLNYFQTCSLFFLI